MASIVGKALPMIVSIPIVIKKVHFANVFEAGNNGYEIPLYRILMLFTLTSFGAGKFSIDHLLKRKWSTQ